ncbi:MAG: CoA pyrophosphatase [Acidaminococcaceae bacterium]
MNKVCTDGFCEEIKTILGKRAAGIDMSDKLWEAAVLVPLVRHNGQTCLLFEVRAASLSRQPGEVCFPGGKRDETDGGLAMTAVRETCEELNLPATAIGILGELDYLVTHMGPIVHPFVGVIDDLTLVQPSADEVQEVFMVPLAYLLQQVPRTACMELANKATEDFPFELLPQYPKAWNRRRQYDIYFYEYEGHVIWGITARILHGFLYRLQHEL